MKKVSIIIALSLIVLLNSCVEDGISTTQTQNQNFTVDFLFENDGCKVYRFKDADRYIYYTSCTGQTTETHLVNSGKHSTVRKVNLSLNTK